MVTRCVTSCQVLAAILSRCRGYGIPEQASPLHIPFLLRPHNNFWHKSWWWHVQVQLQAFDERQRPGCQGVPAPLAQAHYFRAPRAFAACVPVGIPIPDRGRRDYAHDHLKKEDGVVIFEKEFGNDGSDITLGQILAVAWRHLIENDHVTDAGKLEVIFEGSLIFEGYGDLSTRLSTVLVKRFDRQDPSKRLKTCSGSGGRAATPLAEATEVFSLLPPGVAWGPHHTGTTEMATPPPEIMEYMRELRKNNPHAAVIEAVRCEFVKGGWIVKFRRGRIEIEEDASKSSGLVFNVGEKDP